MPKNHNHAKLLRFKTLSTAVLLALSLSMHADSAETETCNIRGRVVSAVSNQPLKGVRVQLRRSDDPKQFYNVTTNPDGQFIFIRVAPGTYRLLARHNRFVPQDYGQKTGEFGSGGPLTLKAGDEIKDLLFKLIPTAAIEGQVMDEDDEPVPGVEVQALVRASQRTDTDTTTPSAAELAPIGTAVTNDLGQFRLYGLPPGGYFVSAIDSGMPELSDENIRSGFGYELADSPQPKYPPTYYPGTTDPSQAGKVDLRAGDDARVDFRLYHIENCKVSGQVLDANGHPVSGASVSISPDDLATEFSSLRYGGESDAGGRFQIKGVASGNYAIAASLNRDQKQWTATQEITVSAADMKGVELVLLPPVTILGRVDFQSSSFQQGGSKIVWLRPISDRSHHFGAGEINTDHTFKVEGLIPDTYTISVTHLAGDSYLAAAHLGSTDVLQNGLTLTGSGVSGTLDLMISPDGASVEGMISKALKAVSGAEVHIDCSDVQMGRGFSKTDAETDQNGQFVFRALPPGKYVVSARESEQSNRVRRASFTVDKKEHKKITIELDVEDSR